MTASTSPQPGFSRLEIITLVFSALAGSLAAMLLLTALKQNNLPAEILPLAWQTAIIRQTQLMGLPLQGDTPAYWYMSRASALMAYFFTWGSTMWGLLLSTQAIKNRISPALTFGVHKFLSFLAIGFAAFHALILLGDHYLHFNLGDILVPFSASFKPVLLGVGTISFYMYTLILISFYIKRQIGPKIWRGLHYLTFLTYLLATAHAIFAGTDTRAMPVQTMYFISAAGVLFLTYYRLLSVNRKKGDYQKSA